jgi:hypothetical protein
MSGRAPRAAYRIMTRFIALWLLSLSFAGAGVWAQSAALTPTQTVREFYKAMREKRFRDAFMMSTYRPAVEGLTPEDLEDLAPDFAATAQHIPEKLDLSDETVAGDAATVMVNLAEPDEPVVPKEMKLRRENGGWIIADEEEAQVKKDGKNYFFRLRIDTHHIEAEEMMTRIYKAQVVFQLQKGRFGQFDELITAELLPADVKNAVSTGYQFRLTVNPDGKGYIAAAEPARYGRTGKLSYYLNQTGYLQRGDAQGKPLTPKKSP